MRRQTFTLSDAAGRAWKLSDFRGRIVTLLFYPGDETMVCTKQLCSLRDNWSRYKATGAVVVGISPGTETEHRKFAGHHNLPLPLLTDTDRHVTRIYGSHKLMPIWATRALVVIDAKGVVRHKDVVLRAFRPSDDDVLAAIHLAQYDVLAGRRVATNIA
ncbi:MAG: peroxiredoxin [Pyrinomonadaceae bacterium]